VGREQRCPKCSGRLGALRISLRSWLTSVSDSLRRSLSIAKRVLPQVSAVWFVGVMGLLDDAIREHLELKRLKGADPGSVAREEQDALGSVPRADEADHGGLELDASSPEARQPLAQVGSAPVVDPGESGEETVEINMEAELASEAGFESVLEVKQREQGGPVAHPAHGRTVNDESLEWEVPGHLLQEAGKGGEIEEGGGSSNDAEPVEDVLEETPDFLRDTPEQERLWFEQRPPRDFDFNE
jgi:hypothetical protein